MKLLSSIFVLALLSPVLSGCTPLPERSPERSDVTAFATDLKVKEIRPEKSVGLIMLLVTGANGVEFQGIGRPDETFTVGDSVKATKVVQDLNLSTRVKFLVFSH